MKPIKRSVAVLIRRGDSILSTRRSHNDDELPGVWGLPAGSFQPQETLEQLIARIGRTKLGVELSPIRKLADGVQDRPAYELQMELWEATMQGDPTHPEFQWGTLDILNPGMIQGSLCCALALQKGVRRVVSHLTESEKGNNTSAPFSCEYCREDGGELLWQDERVRVVRIDDSEYPGLCRVIWSRHAREMTDLAIEDRAHLMDIVFVVEEAIRQTLKPHKINLASLGNITPHVHWHVIPRFNNDRHFPKPIWATPVRDPAPRDLPPDWIRELKQAVENSAGKGKSRASV